jgi:prepilin-type N-terminal cleavage/methylation domain-containing protein
MAISANITTNTTGKGSGFTLLEIMIAVVILALAITTITGLQSASLSGTRQASNRLRALLIARQLFAAYESIDLSKLQVLSYQGTPSQVLSKLIAVDTPPEGVSEYDALYGVTLELAPWEISDLPPGSVWRLVVQVNWSENPRDALEAAYFVPNG